jgi:hypothetical protein
VFSHRVCSLLLALVVSGCGLAATDHDAAGRRLEAELIATYPDEVVAVSFENRPPLDPPTLFIDLDPGMDPDAQLRFLCDQLWPHVRSVDAAIGVTVSYGWWAEDCDSGSEG